MADGHPNRLPWLRSHGTTLAAVALWLLVWQVASLAVGSNILLAGPTDTLLRLLTLLPTKAFWLTILASTGRITAGFVAGFASALALGLVAARWRAVERILAPALSALKSVPLVCVIVLLLMWVGSRRVSGIAVFLVVFPAVYFSVLEGVHAGSGSLDEVLGVMGLGRVRRFLVCTWQELLPYLVATSRNVCGMAWKAGVAAEVIGSPRGTIGEQVYQSKLLLETADLFAWTIVVVLVSWVCERVFVVLLEGTGPVALRVALHRRWRARSEASRETVSGLRAVGSGEMGLHEADLGYPGGPCVLRDVTLDLASGSRTVLTDASGAGKTTLIRTLAGMLMPLSGQVLAPGSLSLVCQDTRLVESLSAEDNVALVSGLSPSQVRSLLLEMLPEEALGRPVSELSGGQRRRVELVRALAHPSVAVLLDEPFASLDEATHREAAAFVLRHLDGRTLLVASHAPGDVQLLGAREVRIAGD